MIQNDLMKHIIDAGEEKFFKIGFSKVTMDELASDLGMSKKTIYKYFQSKDDLVQAVVESRILHISEKFDEIINSSMDYLEKLHNLWMFIGNILSTIGKQFQDDMRKFRPDLWKRIEEFRLKHPLAKFSNLIDEGIRLGFLRSDINREILILIYITSIQGIINPEILTRHSFSAEQAFKTILQVIFDGILTDDARKKYRIKFTSI